jgi:hypothetical protein
VLVLIGAKEHAPRIKEFESTSVFESDMFYCFNSTAFPFDLLGSIAPCESRVQLAPSLEPQDDLHPFFLSSRLRIPPMSPIVLLLRIR